MAERTRESNTSFAPLSVCVVGLGTGYGHAQTFSGMEDVDLYVCDTDSARVERAQQELNVVGAFSSVDDVLASESIDAVDIALPHYLHRPVAVRAAEAGKHCMTEKPMALSLEEADAMLEAADRAGTRLAVAENYQFMGDSAEACRMIADGMIGTVFMVRVHELWRIGPRPGSWWFRRETAGGGNLISLGVHLTRTLRLLAGGRASQVFALLSDQISPEVSLEGEDTSLLSVRFDNGVVGSVVASWATLHPGPGPRFAVYGTRGSIVSSPSAESGKPQDGQQLVVAHSRIEGAGPGENELRVELPTERYRDSVAAACREFVAWIRTGTDSPIDAQEGRKDLEIVEAAYRSARSGEAIRLPL